MVPGNNHAYGHSIKERHCYEQTKKLKHWIDYFDEDIRIKDLSRKKLLAFQLYLIEEKGLAHKTVNMILRVGTTAYAWLKDREEIDFNPGEKLKQFSNKNKKRGILTTEEAKALFSMQWCSKPVRRRGFFQSTLRIDGTH